MTTAQIKNKFPKSGDVCKSCYTFWHNQKLPPKILKSVLTSKGKPSYTETGIPIVACEFCDGQLIFTLPKDHNAQRQPE